MRSADTKLRSRHADAFQASLAEFRRTGVDAESATLRLATEAAAYWAARTGVRLPDTLERAATCSGARSEAAVSAQTAWLDSLTDLEAGSYLLSAAAILDLPATDFATSPSLIGVTVAALTARSPTMTGRISVVDPAVGSGGMLAAAADVVRTRGGIPELAGQDIVPETACFAAAALFLNGEESHITVDNSLTTDAPTSHPVAIAVSSPPIGLGWSSHAVEVERRRNSDGWYRFGLPSRSDSSWLFASRMLERLRPPEHGGGRAITFLSPSAAARQRDGDVRQTLIEADLVDLIVALPSGLLGFDFPLYAVGLTNTKPERLRGRVQVVDLRSYFEAVRSPFTAKRTITHKGFEVLQRALASTKDGPSSRTIPNERLVHQKVLIRRKSSGHDYHRTDGSGQGDIRSDSSEGHQTWPITIPVDANVTSTVERRYGSTEMVTFEETAQFSSSFDVDVIFDASPDDVSLHLANIDWGYTRLSALIRRGPSEASDEPNLKGESLILPLDDGPATPDFGAVGEVHRGIRFQLDPELASPEFLANWLNSAIGWKSRRAAIRRASGGSPAVPFTRSIAAQTRLADELVIPHIAPDRQAQLMSAQGRLDAAARMVRCSVAELWDGAAPPASIATRFDRLLDDSLGSWCEALPAPVASALRTLETDRANVHAAHKQAFRVWEAYAAFWGTVLLSALCTDPTHKREELSTIRQTLRARGLTLERATFGTWTAVIQRLSRHFRDRILREDSEESNRVIQAFGGPDPTTLQQLLSPCVVELIVEANAKRNAWDGHGAKVSEAQLTYQLEHLDSLLQDLRSEIGSSWLNLRLMRAGDGRRHGGRITQTVEELVGPATPFMVQQVVVGDLMECGELYVAAGDALEPLHILPLMVMRASPGSVQDTCYFFNRMDGANVRLVSYQLSSDGEVVEPLVDVRGAVSGLLED